MTFFISVQCLSNYLTSEAVNKLQTFDFSAEGEPTGDRYGAVAANQGFIAGAAENHVIAVAGEYGAVCFVPQGDIVSRGP